MRKSDFHRAMWLGCYLLLAACARPDTALAPVTEKSFEQTPDGIYTVKPGDNLYKISLQFGLDYKKLAAWNQIADPNVVRSGRKLRLRPPPTANAAGVKTQPKPAAAKPKPKPAKTLAEVKPRTPQKWHWPAKGKLIGKYAKGGNNGIQIAAKAGTAIHATAGGEVVYVGEGLRGYGKLVIVKHDREFLSAYAHNESILVNEGDSIKPRQKIARMGKTGAKRTMLHFEIRQDGQPVDPLRYLK